MSQATETTEQQPKVSELVELPGHGLLAEPDLLFHPDRLSDRSPHPLRGLLDYGPFSNALINAVLDPIRVATIAPAGETVRLTRLLAEFGAQHQPRERRDYLPPFPGFQRVFGLRLVSAGLDAELPNNLEQKLQVAKPHLALAEHLTGAIAPLESRRSDFDVLLIYLPDRWQHAFEGGEGEDFNLHDYLKAMTAMRGIATQIVNEDGAASYFCRASVMWRLAIAIYTKAGGVPWKLADADPDTAFIGLSYALRPRTNEGARFVTCCSQVFDSDGAGLEFIAYETDDVHVERDNPFLSHSEMRRVMARSLALYQRRHGGRTPRKVIVHKTTEFKPDEAAGCLEALQAAAEVELIQVKQNVGWRGVKIEAKKRPAGYPVDRGSYLQIGEREVLLWTQGNARTVVGGKDYYKEGKGIPSPLELVRFAGHGGWEDHCRATLGLTKMNWNNDALYDRLPVTLGYAQVLARTIKRMPRLASQPYPVRLFM
jgi:hypothetical protein